MPSEQHRDRLAEYVRARRRSSDDMRSRMVEVAAGNVQELFQYLDIGTADVEKAQQRFIATSTRRREWVTSRGGGMHEMDGEGLSAFEDNRSAHWELIYRSLTYFVFARIALDAIAALIDQAFAPSQVTLGTHSAIETNLERMGIEKGLKDDAELIEHALSLSETVKDFRDDYVVHAAKKKPRAVRHLTIPVDGDPRIGIGLEYPREGEATPPEPSEVSEVDASLDRYLGSVLDLIEQLPMERLAPPEVPPGSARDRHPVL